VSIGLLVDEGIHELGTVVNVHLRLLILSLWSLRGIKNLVKPDNAIVERAFLIL
jgi:hypothetical protein